MPRDKRKLELALQTKGFRVVERHHRYFIYHTRSGQKTAIRTRASHGRGEISDYLLAQMARQCQLSKSEFLDLVDCPMSQHDYEESLQQRNML